MAFKDTIRAMMNKHSSSKADVSRIMDVSLAQVYRYLSGVSEPKWSSVLLLLDGLGYKLKIVKKESVDVDKKLEEVMVGRVSDLKEGRYGESKE